MKIKTQNLTGEALDWAVQKVLKSNLVHLDFQSAEIHAKALIEVSKGWWK